MGGMVGCPWWGPIALVFCCSLRDGVVRMRGSTPPQSGRTCLGS